jgi:ring-1,2-phenylacetyl-CoA epoxidase subunit PaaB
MSPAAKTPGTKAPGGETKTDQPQGKDFQAEGGHGAVPTAGVPTRGPDPKPAGSWPVWEVFVRARRGLSHNHVGSLHAPDADIALRNARDVYTRRQEGVSIWVVPNGSITATSPDEKDAFFEPAGDKAYRFPTFYDIPGRVQM